jgi:hypothetical protein
MRPLSERRTTYEFAITIDDVAVWPAYGSDDVLLEIQIDDLLSHLTEYWKPLMLRQVYPLDVRPLRPSELRHAAEQRWEDLPESIVEAEEETISDFEEAHDLARCFSGIFGLPSFWILRSGDEFTVETENALWRLSFEEVRRRLNCLGTRSVNVSARLIAIAGMLQSKHGGAATKWTRRACLPGPPGSNLRWLVN